MANTTQQKKFAALAKQSKATTEFNNSWSEFKDEPSVAAAHDVIDKAKEVLGQSNATGKQMIPSSNVMHRQYIAEDYLDNPPAETTKKGFGSNTEYKNIKHPKTGEIVYAKVTKYSFGN
jgi:hypothetical protein